ncbi:MAG: hypothetical protein M3O34_08825 [Chloroflexota bacterium]|nr:hypothetical protein [Chloroflexota bacterium]
MQKLSATHPLHVDPQYAGTLPGSVGVEREEWYAEARRSGETVIVSMTAGNPRRALEQLIASGDPVDRWFKDEVRALTGLSLTALFGRVLLGRRVRH